MRYYFSCMVLSSDCKAHHNNMTWFVFNTLRPLQNYCQISDGIFQNAFYLKKSLVFGKIAMGFVHRVLIDNKSALVVPVIARHHTYLIMYLFVNSLKVSLYTIYIYICTNKLHSTYYCIVCILLIVKGHNSQVYSTQHGKSVVYWDIMNKTYEDNLICYDS